MRCRRCPSARRPNFSRASSSTGKKEIIARRIFKEIDERLGFLENVGLSYLTLDRAAYTLSGGESQRIRLATQIGSKLTGVLYVLDEPSIGLHQRDNRRLLNTLMAMRDLGNTVLVVEHDEETIRSADHVVDMGPGAGMNGGARGFFRPPGGSDPARDLPDRAVSFRKNANPDPGPFGGRETASASRSRVRQGTT